MTLAANKYSILRRIAISGRAETLLSSQRGLGGLEKLVVIKRILPQVAADSQFTQVFLEESRRALTLRHPNLVEIYDVTHEGDLYLVVEYISGEDLRYIIKQISGDEMVMPVGIACRIVAQLADALHTAHTATDPEGRPLDILHLTVAPRNIMISYNGAAKLLDVGVGKADLQDAYTLPGALKTHLSYRSPERIQHRELDACSDVYSLGIVLYELLSHRRLFKGDNEAAVLKAVMEMNVPPPSQLNQNVPTALDDVVLNAIKRDPEERTPTAMQLREQLEQYLASTKTFVSDADVAKWMQSVLKDRWSERQTMEQAASVEARDSSSSPGELPPLFSGGSHVSSVTPSSASGSGISMGGLSAPGTASQYGAPRRETSRGLLLLLIGSIATLVLVALFGVAYWMGKGDEESAQPAGQATNTADRDEAAGVGMVYGPVASLLIHVNPQGATVKVDGEMITEDASVDGVLAGVSSNKAVKVEVSKKGYVTKIEEVKTQEKGTQHVYVNLVRDKPATAVAAATTTPPASAEPVEQPAKSTTVTPPGKALATKGKKPGRRRFRRARVAKAKPGQGAVDISFTPPSASLTVDGVLRPGLSPVKVANLGPGSHSLKLEAPGYRTHTQTFDVAEGKRLALNVRLQKKIDYAAIEATSIPVGATVKIDGKFQGRTPIKGLRLEAGRSYAVLIEYPGYEPYRKQLKPKANSTVRLTANLRKSSAPAAVAAAKPAVAPKPPVKKITGAAGSVQVLSPNVYGAVWINGKEFGYPPLVADDVAAGTALVQIKVGGKVRLQKRIKVLPDKRIRVTFK